MLVKGSYQQVSPARLGGIISGTPFTQRGFTDHEHLDAAQLIHMNGRVYDYNLGRFLSVDPLIQAPTSSQSMNPYSYIMNNPLSGIDPTGYCSTDDDLKGCADGLEAGETQVISSAGGKKVGHIGKDSRGNVHITNNGSDKGQAEIKSSMANLSKPADIGAESGKNKSTNGAVKSGPDDENSFVNSSRKGLDSALTKVNGLRDKLNPFETEGEAAVWLNDNAGNLQEKYGAEVGAFISKVYGEKTGWKIGDVVTSYHSNYVNLATSKIRAGKMDYIDTSIKGKSDWHTHSSGSHYASWGQDRDSHKSFYRAYVSSVGRNGKASLSLYNALAARKEAWPLTRTAFDNANSCLVGGCR